MMIFGHFFNTNMFQKCKGPVRFRLHAFVFRKVRANWWVCPAYMVCRVLEVSNLCAGPVFCDFVFDIHTIYNLYILASTTLVGAESLRRVCVFECFLFLHLH